MGKGEEKGERRGVRLRVSKIERMRMKMSVRVRVRGSDRVTLLELSSTTG